MSLSAKVFLFSICTISLFATSCQFDPYADQYTMEKPGKDEVTGTYKLKEQTINQDIKTFNDSLKREVVPTLIINSDGTFDAMNIPHFMQDTVDIKFKLERLISAKGKWEIATAGTIDDGSGNVKEPWGLDLSAMPIRELRSAALMSTTPPYQIIFGYGDPDEGKAMIFTKQ